MRSLLFTIILILSLPNESFSQLGVKGGLAVGKTLQSKGLLHYGLDLGFTYEVTERFRAEVLFEGMFRNNVLTLYDPNDYALGQKLEDNKTLSSFIPITVGVDYSFFKGKLKPFVGLNLGVMTLGTRLKGESYYSHYFTFHPKVGVNYALTENIVIDFTFKHHVIVRQASNGSVNNPIIAGNLGVQYNF
ncbi:hypothetical protein ERX46_09475 [Brumimicrobium glaciale]|uniref:Outer membrane protein beta-barrel domain-containing protein n=1 Tax=Brumimicrobium glaciale TaxID=200475 RepID=A0A4Q4KM42_9FLAO|nr:outer membrane beta-barrel protein [Brumimicrobium glaciale]RYM34178.1 hypothetical protein ERX46_09475 [Brumimicrobium glaciale]